MNTARRHRAAALLLSLAVTLAIVSGVGALAGDDHAARLLARSAPAAQG